jgi:hypothetical protein
MGIASNGGQLSDSVIEKISSGLSGPLENSAADTFEADQKEQVDASFYFTSDTDAIKTDDLTTEKSDN